MLGLTPYLAQHLALETTFWPPVCVKAPNPEKESAVALGFAASALAVAARDEWVGWSAALRRKRLHRVLALSRFLIRPSVRCHLLASKVLGQVLRRLPQDFCQRYGYRPALLETFCDPQQHAGTCFRAANWICVGHTVLFFTIFQ